MENLAQEMAQEIQEKLQKGVARTLVDIDLINHLKEKSEIPFYDMKLIMIEDEDGFHLISMKGIGPSYHCIIAMTYMIEFEKNIIKILGGGRIKFEDSEFIISDKSGSFGIMEKEKVDGIMKNLNVNFRMSYSSSCPLKGAEYSFGRIAREVYQVLSD